MKICAPGLRSSRLPGTNCTTGVLRGTMTFFSPSEYFTIMIWPSTLAHTRFNVGICHRASWFAIPRQKPSWHDATLCGHKNVESNRLLAAVGLWHRSNADKIAHFDIGERGLDHRG